MSQIYRITCEHPLFSQQIKISMKIFLKKQSYKKKLMMLKILTRKNLTSKLLTILKRLKTMYVVVRLMKTTSVNQIRLKSQVWNILAPFTQTCWSILFCEYFWVRQKITQNSCKTTLILKLKSNISIVYNFYRWMSNNIFSWNFCIELFGESFELRKL